MKLIHYVPLNRWLAWLADGWNFGSETGLPVADVMPGGHGAYSVMLWKVEE